MRIAYLVNLYPAVSHTFIRREIHALERLGFEVERFAVKGWNAALADPQDREEQAKTRYALQGGLAALILPVLTTLVSSPVRFARALMLALRLGFRAFRPLPYHLVFLAQACRLHAWMRDAQVQHVHAHFSTNSTELALLVKALGGPDYSFTVHGPTEFDQPEPHKLAQKAAYASFVVAISSFCRSQLYRWIPYAQWNKVEVVHCGLEPAFYDVPTTPPPDRPRLVCVGRICEAKGQLLLVQAAAQVIRKGVPLELVIAGDGELRRELESLIAAFGIEKNVRITGWISSSQVREELLAARALILPSFAEGLPVVIMEAMALGRPVVTTYVAGIPELVRAGESGWLFPAGDVDQIAEAIQACLEAPTDSLVAMGAAARARVLARHSVDREAEKLARCFRRSAQA
jgi:glycosyltransferase involved in cell wall biosynthesis